ncbi:MAG: YraN family protein [Candidatus Moraniibacteriota bacterium]
MFWQKNQKSIGEQGEDWAVKYLKKKKFRIIERNYQNKLGRRLGEIDIIAEKEGEIIFIEVKTRVVGAEKIILPEENITRQKLHKLQKIARDYIREKNLWEHPYRFDAVSILLKGDKAEEIRHLESIFY